MTPTRAFQKYKGCRIIGFEPLNSAFCVLQENTVARVNVYLTPRVTIPDKSPRENNNTFVWNDTTVKFVQTYPNEIFHFLKLTIGSDVEQIKTHIIICSQGSSFCNSIRLHSGTGVQSALNYFPYELKLAYTEIDFKEFL